MGHTIVAIVCIAGLHLIACHDVPTWPDGTYALPESSSGCPSGGGEDGFFWSTGCIQDNENSNNENYCPSPWVFEGYCKKNLKLCYCFSHLLEAEFKKQDAAAILPYLLFSCLVVDFKLIKRMCDLLEKL